MESKQINTGKQVIPIFFSIDKNVEMPCGVAITSLLESAEADTFYDIFILHGDEDDFSGSLLNQLPSIYKNCDIHFRNVGAAFETAFEIRGITRPTYYRLVAPKLIPEYDKLIYYDVDIIFRRDLTDLYMTSLDNHYFGAVNLYHELPPCDIDYVQNTLKLGLASGYFSAGALLMNAQLIRHDSMMDVFIEMAKNNYTFQDQDVINLSCKGRIRPLPLEYNMTNYAYENLVLHGGDRDDVCDRKILSNSVVHYNGPKPWKDTCLNMDLWWNVYRRSIFFDEKFAYEFWMGRPSFLDKMPLSQRIKLTLKYFRR